MPKVPITVKFEVSKVEQIQRLTALQGTVSDFIRDAVDRAIRIEEKKRARDAKAA